MNSKGMQHGFYWDGRDVSGYIATEKFNGCRGFWDGHNLYSKNGNQIKLPASWRAVLPKAIPLDGEVYDGPDGVYRVGGAFRAGRIKPSMRFMVFDCPGAEGDYISRLNYAKKHEAGPVKIVSYKIIKNISEAIGMLNEVVTRHGEGLMLRHPAIQYIPGKTIRLLKFKESCLPTDK